MEERSRLIAFLKEKGIMAVFHYIPLHSAPAGMKFGRFHGEDRYTTKESERLLRLPMFYTLTADQTEYITEQVKAFYGAK
jgi:dTDP-4-amino-4,6-dideoxygalactose transaminase